MSALQKIRERLATRKGRRHGAASPAKDVLREAICIPVGGSKVAFVLGVDWQPHLTREAVFASAVKKAKARGANFVYTKPGGGDFHGVAQIGGSVSKEYEQLVPLSVALGKQVSDKNARALYLVDLRAEEQADGIVFVGSAARGNPVREVIVPVRDALAVLREWAADSRTGANVFVDTQDRDLFEDIAAEFPTASALPLFDIEADKADALRSLPSLNIKRQHVVLGAVALLGVVGYFFGVDYYEQQVVVEQEANAKKNALTQYLATRQQEWESGYRTTPKAGLDAVLSEMRKLPLMRNGWSFGEAVCMLESGICEIVWKREYGTFDSFIESAAPERVTIDSADYRTLKENWPFKVVVERPPMESLPMATAFAKDNGDRADTFALAGISDFAVSPLAEVVPWTGQGVAPGPVLMNGKWALSAAYDLAQEAIFNGRLGPEYGLNKVTVTNNGGGLTLKFEGNVYARNS